MDNLKGNKTIAKNTLMMYIRMFYGMVVSLFVTRYILEALGVVDYGIYSVVGSVVSMFVFLRSMMSNSLYRFIAFAIGEGDRERMKTVFSTGVIIHIVLAFLIIILCETIGLWFFYNKLAIPPDRMTAAMWCYQLSVVSCVITVISAPYDAEIIAHEKMNVYAIVQIGQSTFNLVIAYVLLHTLYDKLIVYAALVLLVQIIIRLFYGIYCGKKFTECSFSMPKDKCLFKELVSFAGWTLLRHMARVAYTQGTNILLNIFCGPVVNAAKAISQQVHDAIYGFVSNFQIAAQPQIIKSYASKDINRTHELVFFISKISIILLLVFLLPIFIETPMVLKIWLGTYPEHTVSFIRIFLIIMFVYALDFPLGCAIEATGRIKKYNLIVSLLYLVVVILGYISLNIGFMPESVFVIQFVILCSVLIVKMKIVKSQINISIQNYIFQVLLRPAIVAFLSAIIPVILYLTLPNNLLSFCMICILCIMGVVSFGYIIGIGKNERKQVREMVLSIIHKRRM